jgi:hypothetical protein
MRLLRPLLLATLPAALAAPAAARPNLDEPRPLGSLILYPDDQKPGLLYYGPGELGVARAADGRPDIHFLQMRYTGSAVGGDRGRILYQSILGFRVTHLPPSASDLQAARKSVPGAVELRPLPIRRLDATLVYASVGQPAGEGTPLPGGHFEAAEDPAAASPGAFWTSRSYVLGLDAATAELFGHALARGQVVLSVSYSFSAAEEPPAKEAPAKEPRVVRAGAFAITVDAARWPDVLKRVDVNERMPPGYPVLDVYCYDFGGRAAALYEKQVEIEAESPGGGTVTARARFGRDQADLYARSVRFGLAVRLDRPYRYRVTEVAEDGTSAATPWRARQSWAELLDITTPADAIPRPAPDESGGER